MAKPNIESSPVKNFKVGSNKLLDKGIVTLIKLLVIAVLFYVLYQILIFLSVGDAMKDFYNALQSFESDPNNTSLLKDAFINFGKKAGLTIALSAILLSLLNVIYNLASMRVFVQSAKGKDTGLDESIKFGFERLGLAVVFYIMLSLFAFGYVTLVIMLGLLLPVTLIVTMPAGIVLLFMLIIRVLYSSQILVDDKKPKVMSIFEESKQLVKASDKPLVKYIIFSFVVLMAASALTSFVTGLFGLRPTNQYNLTTNYWDVLYNTITFLVTAVFGFFLTAGWVEIYEQAKQSLKQSQKPKAKK